jgi:hypothetical protein
LPALVGDVVRLEPGVAHRLFHSDVVPRCAATKKAQGAAIDGLLGIERRRAVNLAAESELGVFLRSDDARLCLTQAGENLLGVVADG